MNNPWKPSDIQVPKLSPSDLFYKRRERDESRLVAYNKILEEIQHRIRKSSMNSTSTHILYNIPPFIHGLPRIDLKDCVVYIVYILRHQGFEVRYTYPDLLYISWKQHERDYFLKESPIIQAMISTAPKKPVATSTRVKFDLPASPIVTTPGGYGTQQQLGPLHSYRTSPNQLQRNSNGGVQAENAYSMFGTQGKAPPRDIQDYRPPMSFVNALEKPLAEPRKTVINDLANF